ncbi:MAG: hypothetical protein ABI678_00280 [Kofleriaceae bacterium]
MTVRAAFAELKAAYEANDLARWQHARHEVDVAITHAERKVEQTRGQLHDASAATTSAFAATTLELIAETAAIRMAEPPAGYVTVELERELLAALRAPSVAGFAGRRDAVRAEVDQLSIADLRVLRARIASPRPQDELAQEIWKLGPTLRQEVAAFIENVDRRKARERAASARRPQPPPAPEPETVDTKLRRAVEGDSIEADLRAVIATLDGTARRALAIRFRSYRPGTGDDIAARFALLDRGVREQILDELASERRANAAPAIASHPGSVFALEAQQIDRSVQPITGTVAATRMKPEEYLLHHASQVWDVVGRYLARVAFPPPSPRLVWRDDVAFAAATVAKLREMHLFDRHDALLEVLYPANPHVALATLIPIGDHWVPTVGSALAQLFEQAIVASLRRLGPRWVELAEHRPEPAGVADETQSLVAASSLTASAPIDRAVREGLTSRAVVELVDTHRRAPRDGVVRALRPVQLEWQGARDPQMWNWVRVTSPTDASAEEVAAALWKTDHGAEHAYGLTASGSFFGVPASWAREFAEAKQFAPKGRDATSADQLVHLAAGTHADDLALDAAAHEPHANARPHEVTTLLGDVAIQLAHLVQLFAPWQLDADVAIAIRWVTGKQRELATAPAGERATWAPIIAGQKDRLFRIFQAVKGLAGTGHIEPMRRIVATYARATATSFLGAASERLIANAVHEQTTLSLTAVRASTNDLAIVIGDGDGLDPKQLARAEGLAGEARLLQTGALAGKATDPDDVERIILSTQELALHLRIEQIHHQIRALRAAAAQATDSRLAKMVAAFPGKFHDLDSVASAFDNHLLMVESAWKYDVSGASQIRDPDAYAVEMLKLRRAALASAQIRFASIKTDDGLAEFLQHGASVIERELRIVGWVTACVQLLVLIGVGMVATAGGGAVAETIAGWGASAEAVEGATMLARTTRLLGRAGGIAGRAGGLVAEAAINTAGQRAFQQPGDDPSFVEGMAENALMSLGGQVILSRIGKDLEFAKEIERSTGSMWARTRTAGAVVLAKGITITSHVIINAATAYVAHQIVKGGHAEPSNATLGEWFMQGAAVAIGRYVHGQIGGRHELYAKLAKLHELEGAQRLLQHADHLLGLAAAAEEAPTDRHALDLLAQQRALLTEELAVLEAAASDPAKQRALDLAAPTLRGMKRFAESRLAELDATDFADLALRSGKLEELVPGEVWQGTRRQIDDTLAAAARARLPTEGVRGADGVWKLQIGAREMTVREVAGEKTKPAEAVRETPRSASEQVPQPKTKELIRSVGSAKAYGEQHAHAPGSVPIDAVLAMVSEWNGITPEQRAQQIDLLHELIAELTSDNKNREVHDLRPASVEVRDGAVHPRDKVTIASVQGSVDVGLLNALVTAKQRLQAARTPTERGRIAKEIVDLVAQYRGTIAMQKPDATTYAGIDTTYEFFVRYKMIAAHGLGTAEIAARRASAGQLGMQELRYGSDDSSVETLHAEADALLRKAPLDADVSETFATTKNRLATPDAAKNEQHLMVEFVKAWEIDPTLERAFNGFESAGVEDARKPPALLWEAAAQRAFRNALRVRARLAEALTGSQATEALVERMARVSGTSPADAEVMLARYRATDFNAAISATETRGQALRARGTVTMPEVDLTTQQVIERFAGQSIEQTAADTRLIVEALRTWSAEAGVQHGDVALLGLTMHAGEQLLNEKIDPFTLLDQVDQAVSLGVDRIGHGLVLGIDADVLVKNGRLQRERVDDFRRRQQEVVARVRARGIVVETNLSSNTEISNLTQGQHPAGIFVREGLRVTVNTDDETVLATTIEREYERVSRARGIVRHDIAKMILEAYRSRMGNRELAQRARLKPLLADAFLTSLDPEEAVSLASDLANHFRVAHTGSPRDIIVRVLDATLGL